MGLNRGCMLSFLHPFRTCRIFFRVSLGKPPFNPKSRKGRKYAARLEELGRKEEAEEEWKYKGRYAEGFDEIDEQMEMEI
jgi:hypothetical protein